MTKLLPKKPTRTTIPKKIGTKTKDFAKKMGDMSSNYTLVGDEERVMCVTRLTDCPQLVLQDTESPPSP